MANLKEELIKKLVEAGCVKFGEFTLKSGLKSNYYVDLREATEHRPLFKLLVSMVGDILKTINNPTKSKVVVGVPYGVVPLAGAVADRCDLPYKAIRKETKDYGNEQESNHNQGAEFVLVEDVMSTASSIVEALKKLEGKKVTDVIVVVNRGQGGEELLQKEHPDIKLHYLLTASDLLNYSRE